MKEYLNENWHGFAGAAVVGFVCKVVGFSVLDWQYYLIVITSVAWYVTKPSDR